MNKSELRKLYLQKRLALSEVEYSQMSSLICEQFFSSIDLSVIKVIHIFLPIYEKREPDTWLIVNRIRSDFPHIRLSNPRINSSGVMENIYFKDLHQLEKSNWGIEEPTQGLTTSSEEIDLVIVPMLCADKRGNRVGYGKGYYDRFLIGCKPETKRIGLSFFEAVDFVKDVDELDVALSAMVTPSGLTSF